MVTAKLRSVLCVGSSLNTVKQSTLGCSPYISKQEKKEGRYYYSWVRDSVESLILFSLSSFQLSFFGEGEYDNCNRLRSS